MASSGKKKTTMAKLNRESKMRERRLDKQARKDARKLAAENPPTDDNAAQTGESAAPDDRRPALDAVGPPPHADA